MTENKWVELKTHDDTPLPTDLDKVEAQTQKQGTLIVTRTIKPEFDDLHAEWQLRIQKACAAFPGFVKRKVYPPTPGLQNYWTHVITFDTIESAHRWSDSSVFKALWAEVTEWTIEEKISFVSPEVPGAEPKNTGTLIITRSIKPEFEALHTEWLVRIQAACAAFPGFVKRKVYPPIPGFQNYWTHVVTFDTMDSAHRWSDCSVCKSLMVEVSQWTSEESMGFVLTDPQGALTFGIIPTTGGGGGVAAAPLPIKYRQCLVIILNLFPVMLLYGYLLEFVFGNWRVAVPVRLLIGACLTTPSLTFYMIPYSLKYLGPWVLGSSRVSTRQDAGITLSLIAFIILLAFVTGLFWPESGYAGDGIFGR